ncbi:hypothetical protein [Flammeovirga sp. SJP92]|uniref:hypothetical protein n=1 Tax=Flammeovirga sp. SJP92 TaxID=1775430 RepID=UPI000786ADFA|nr:hypothetical protein [Flammeovirga sp. SJP92]KXX71368.1 hypothetical protein AVL50_32415 [Flammeovirga sp. SJP92]
MNQIFAILIISLTLFACKGQQNSNVKDFESGFSLIQDTISMSVNGRMTHALEYKDKYYVLFEQRLMKYGGYGKRWLYIFSNNQLEKVIDCPTEMKTVYLDFYVQNDSIILKPYMDKQSYYLDNTNLKWNKVDKTDDLIWEDSDFYVYTLDFGEWGGKTWFKDKKTDSQYVLESTTPLINKIDSTYYLTNFFKVLRINNPKELTKCDGDVTYENIEKTGKNYSWYSESKGYKVIYEDENVDYFDFSYHPSIVSSFVYNGELLHIFETDTASYLSRIVNNKIQPFEKILNDVKFFNSHFSYRCKNFNGSNELLKFKTSNDQIYGLTTIKDNRIYATFLVNDFELKPKTLGKERSNAIFENRLRTILVDFSNLPLTKVESKEKEWKTFDITPNHKIGIGDSWNPRKYDIDINKSYLVVEDSIISNSIMYYATKKTDLVRAITMNWEKTQTDRIEFGNEKSTSEVFLKRFNDLVMILTNELGKPNSINEEKKNQSFVWTTENNINVEIKLSRQDNYNNIRMVVYERK